MNTPLPLRIVITAAALCAACTTGPDDRPFEDTGLSTGVASDSSSGTSADPTGQASDDGLSDDGPGGGTCTSATCGDPGHGETSDHDTGTTGSGSSEDDATGCVQATWYLDVDGDGFGDSRNAIESCDPVGNYDTQQSGDCCDTDPDAHPDQETFFSQPNLCGHYDYNCDGSETPSLLCECVIGEWSMTCSEEPSPNCTVPACGTQNLVVCKPAQTCDGLVTTTSHGTQTCN